MALIIAAFPGMGKTYTRMSTESLRIKDLDASKYSKLEDGKRGKIPNPDFPKNYIDAIEVASKSNDYDVVFVSTPTEIRELMSSRKIDYILISPYNNCKNAIIERFKERGNSQRFINNMYNNWSKYMLTITNDPVGYQIKFKEDEVITSDFLDRLVNNFQSMVELTVKNSNNKNMDRDLKKYDVFWPNLCRTRKGWNASEIRMYKDFLDWDVLCKYNVLPDEIIKDPSFKRYINFDYLKDNIKKYNIKIRKMIK